VGLIYILDGPGGDGRMKRSLLSIVLINLVVGAALIASGYVRAENPPQNWLSMG